MGLKKHVKELKELIAIRENELEQFKRNMRSTKLLEAEAEIKALREETGRMRNMLVEVMHGANIHTNQVNNAVHETVQ